MIDSGGFNNHLQNAVRSKLPKDVNIATILSEILSIGKEAVYRRLRGEVQFSFNEAALIAKKTGISLDSIINSADAESLFFEFKSHRYYNLRDTDYNMLKEYLYIIKAASQHANSEQVYTSNLFPQFLTHFFPLLFKYNSFRWSYVNQNIVSIKPFHELEYSECFYQLNKTIVEEMLNIKNTYCIWDSPIFESVVKEINYFRTIRLIEKNDVSALKTELLQLLEVLENITAKGEFRTGNKVQVYVSNITSDAGYSYLESENIHLSMIGIFGFNYMMSLESKTLQKMKERINSLKRVSTLISESGEIERIQFFNKQRKMVNTL